MVYVNSYKIGDELKLLLLDRREDQDEYRFTHKVTESGFSEQFWESNFSRVRFVKDVDKLFEKDLFDLRRQIISADPVYEQPYLVQVEERILGQINRTKADMLTKTSETSISSSPSERTTATVPSESHMIRSSTKQLYQSQDGQNYFIDSLNQKCLQHEFGSKLPAIISGRILDIWGVVLNEEERKYYCFLKHLPPLSEVFFVELDLSHLLSKETMEVFGPVIEQRKHHRAEALKLEDMEKAAAIDRDEQSSLERYLKLCLQPIPAMEVAPEISDEKAFPSLGQRGGKSNPKPRLKSQQPTTRPLGPKSTTPKTPVTGLWGKRPKIGANVSTKKTPRLLKIQTRGARKGKKVVRTTQMNKSPQHRKPPTATHLSSPGSFRR